MAYVTDNYPELPAEAQYNLFCYHRDRLEICQAAITAIDEKADENLATERARLEDRLKAEAKATQDHAKRALQTQDPVIAARVEALRRTGSGRRSDGGPYATAATAPSAPSGNGLAGYEDGLPEEPAG